MKILLISANTRAQGAPSLGIAYLANYLRKYLPNIKLDIKLMNYIPKDLSKITKFSPDIIGISTLTNQYKNSIIFAKEIKRSLKAPVIIGGQVAFLGAGKQFVDDFAVRQLDAVVLIRQRFYFNNVRNILLSVGRAHRFAGIQKHFRQQLVIGI